MVSQSVCLSANQGGHWANPKPHEHTSAYYLLLPVSDWPVKRRLATFPHTPAIPKTLRVSIQYQARSPHIGSSFGEGRPKNVCLSVSTSEPAAAQELRRRVVGPG